MTRKTAFEVTEQASVNPKLARSRLVRACMYLRVLVALGALLAASSAAGDGPTVVLPAVLVVPAGRHISNSIVTNSSAMHQDRGEVTKPQLSDSARGSSSDLRVKTKSRSQSEEGCRSVIGNPLGRPSDDGRRKSRRQLSASGNEEHP